jgi:hypothetical protein
MNITGNYKTKPILMATDKEDKRPNQPGQGGGKNQAIDPKEKQQHGEMIDAPEILPNEGSGMPKEFEDEFHNLSQKIKPQVNGEFDHHTPEEDDLDRKKD